MFKHLLKVTVLAASVLAMTSCGVTQNTATHSSPVRSRAVNLDPIKADININEEEKLSGSSSSTYVIGFRVSGDQNYADGVNFSTMAFHLGRVRQVKSAAAYNAMLDKGYDVLVHPTYNIKVERGIFVQKYTATVEGYGGKYENFRTERQKIIYLDGGKELILQDRD
jgi:hypothetical protein